MQLRLQLRTRLLVFSRPTVFNAVRFALLDSTCTLLQVLMMQSHVTARWYNLNHW